MYNLNTTAARQADERSGRIAEIGKYVGSFTRAEDITSPRGTRGIDFAFETADRQSANFTLWTLNKEGKEIFGFKQLQALMTCLKVKQLKPVSATVKKWSRESNAVEEFDGEVFNDLMGKPIGILFETEEYAKTDGGIGIKVVPAAFFEANSELMASEILDKKVTPAQLAKILLTLKHKPLKAGATQTPHTPSGGGGAEFDDDIPFTSAYARAAWSAV